jgi:hypothetical protein
MGLCKSFGESLQVHESERSDFRSRYQARPCPNNLTGENMKTYTGTKTINAKPMTRGDYNKFRGWEIPADEDPAEAGYLVEYTDGGLTKKFNDLQHGRTC